MRKTKEQRELEAALKQAKFTTAERTEVDGKSVFVVSDSSVDRDGEVLDVNGWDLENFLRNPVMLWSHDPYTPAIGKWKDVAFMDVNGKKKLVMTPDFHRKSELSNLIADLVEAGYPPQTTSVGFRAKEMDGNRYTSMELLETSFVNIPANPEATTLALSKGHSEALIAKVFGAKDEAGDDIDTTVDDPADEEEAKPEETPEEEKALTRADVAALVQPLHDEIKRLEILVQEARKPAQDQQPAGTGRSDQERKAREQKALIQAANKALSRVLFLQKQNG